MIYKRTLLAGIGALLLPVSATAQAQENKWFIQVYTVPLSEGPIEIDEEANVGRIEVSGKQGDFVACAQAFGIKSWNSFILAPLSIGFIYFGDTDNLKFEAYGELKRKTKLETKFTRVQT